MNRSRRPQALARTVELGRQSVDFALQRSSRRRTIGLRIDERGLCVTAPPWSSEADIDSAVRSHARWIIDKLRIWHARDAELAPLAFADGDLLLWLGQEVPIRRVATHLAIPRPISADQTLLAIPLGIDCDDPAAALTAWYSAQATPWFRRRAAVFSERLGRLIERAAR